MKSIEIVNENQKAVFTPRSVCIDGEEFVYASVTELTHCAQDRRYSITAAGRQASVTYAEKDAEALKVLFSRIAQLRGLAIKENKEDAAPAVSSESAGLLQRPVFLVAETAVALALIAVGVYLLFFSF